MTPYYEDVQDRAGCQALVKTMEIDQAMTHPASGDHPFTPRRAVK